MANELVNAATVAVDPADVTNPAFWPAVADQVVGSMSNEARDTLIDRIKTANVLSAKSDLSAVPLSTVPG